MKHFAYTIPLNSNMAMLGWLCFPYFTLSPGRVRWGQDGARLFYPLHCLTRNLQKATSCVTCDCDPDLGQNTCAHVGETSKTAPAGPSFSRDSTLMLVALGAGAGAAFHPWGSCCHRRALSFSPAAHALSPRSALTPAPPCVLPSRTPPWAPPRPSWGCSWCWLGQAVSLIAAVFVPLPTGALYQWVGTQTRPS